MSPYFLQDPLYQALCCGLRVQRPRADRMDSSGLLSPLAEEELMGSGVGVGDEPHSLHASGEYYKLHGGHRAENCGACEISSSCNK